MRILSLFDGISCARVSLDRASIPVTEYLASEIDKNAIAVSTKNYPDIKQVGSVVGLSIQQPIDLLIGGSPCTDLSIAKKDREGLEGSRSCLFWEYVRIKEETNPKWFILENVASMPKKDKDIITKALGVEPVLFNASLVSAQCRKRLFWTNIPFTLPEDRGILLKDILQPDAEVDERMVMKGKAFCLTATYSKASASAGEIENSIKRKQRTMVKVGYIGEGQQYGQGGQAHRVYSTEGKTPTLSSSPSLVKVGHIRKLTPIECERLQGLPDDYTKGVATTHRYKCLGNAFNVDVVAHIISQIAKKITE